MNVEKMIQIVNYILKKYDGKLNYTKLIKLLYLADRKSFSEIDSSITGDAYYSLDNGPILSGLYDLIIGNGYGNDQSLWNARFSKSGYDLVVLSDNIPSGLLSEFDKEILDSIDKEYHAYTYGNLIEYTHTSCPEWENPHGTSKKIELEKILECLGRTEDEINEIIEENRIYDKEDEILKMVASL